MNDVPPYLLRAFLVVNRAAAEGLSANEIGETAVNASAAVTTELSTWAADDEFWAAVTTEFRTTRLNDEDIGKVFDEEVEILTRVLQGNRQAAILVALELAQRREGANPGLAREAVSAAVKEGQQISKVASRRNRAWRAAIFLKKAFTIMAGGIGIAADVVSPDVTGLTKVASIVGGVAAIVNA